MVNFESELPTWQAEGVRPPDNMLKEGWKASQKPPADYFNWFFSRTHSALKELQEKAATEENLDLHKVRTDNPHKVTAAQVGLSNVINQKQATKIEFDAHDTDSVRHITDSERNNWNSKANGKHNHYWGDIQNVPIGSLSQLGVIRLVDSVASTDRTKAATPNSVKDAYDRGTQGIADAAAVQKNLDSHSQSKNNPHAVTASQVGLGKVSNFDIATAEEAVVGTSNSKYVTPFTVSEAIKALQSVKSVNGKIGAVILGKSDVGLGNVDNVKQASKSEFDTHANDSDKHITANERTDWNSKAAGVHSHSMSQVEGLLSALIGKTNVKGYSNGSVTLLGETETDLNRLLNSGTFMGNNLSGAPDSGWWYISSLVHNTGFATQVAYRLNTSSDLRPQTRIKVNGTWSNWVILSLTTDNAPTATKLQTARKIAGVTFDGTKDIEISAANVEALPVTNEVILNSSSISMSSGTVTLLDSIENYEALAIESYVAGNGSTQLKIHNNAETLKAEFSMVNLTNDPNSKGFDLYEGSVTFSKNTVKFDRAKMVGYLGEIVNGTDNLKITQIIGKKKGPKLFGAV